MAFQTPCSYWWLSSFIRTFIDLFNAIAEVRSGEEVVKWW